MTESSCTWGDLSNGLRAILKLEPHEWDNKNISEQRDYCLQLLSALQPKRMMYPIQRGPSVPWEVMIPHEAMSQKNHGQSIQRIAERGGFSPCEAWAVVNGYKWTGLEGKEVYDDFAKRWIEYAEKINLHYTEAIRERDEALKALKNSQDQTTAYSEEIKRIWGQREEARQEADLYNRLNAQSVAKALQFSKERDEARAWVSDLQSGMYINCVYCGHRYGPQDKVPSTMADALKAHIEVCEKHPMRAIKKERDLTLAQLKTMRDAAAELITLLKDFHYTKARELWPMCYDAMVKLEKERAGK